jgi:hypothetical protein
MTGKNAERAEKNGRKSQTSGMKTEEHPETSEVGVNRSKSLICFGLQGKPGMCS